MFARVGVTLIAGSLILGSVGTAQAVPASTSQKTEFLASSGTPPWPPCGFFDKSMKVLKKYKRQAVRGYSGATAVLACGNHNSRTDVGWGFRHIKAGHLTQWQREALPLGGSWMDFADWSITQTLAKPCYKAFQASNQTFQYVTPIVIRDQKKRYVKTIGVRVVVSKKTQNIITAYPQKATCR